MAETTTPPARFECPAGIRHDGLNLYFWIRSPRTGRKILIGGGWTQELPPRVIARTAKARGEGKATAMFTRDELAAIVALADRLEERCKPRPGEARNFFPSRSFSRPY